LPVWVNEPSPQCSSTPTGLVTGSMMSAVFSRLTGAMTKVRPTSLAPSFDARSKAMHLRRSMIRCKKPARSTATFNRRGDQP
jgi:hypothetical protein